jgi:hypothetical protein
MSAEYDSSDDTNSETGSEDSISFDKTFERLAEAQVLAEGLIRQRKVLERQFHEVSVVVHSQIIGASPCSSESSDSGIEIRASRRLRGLPPRACEELPPFRRRALSTGNLRTVKTNLETKLFAVNNMADSTGDKPDAFDGNLDKFEEWLEEYVDTTESNQWSNAKKLAWLKRCLKGAPKQWLMGALEDAAAKDPPTALTWPEAREGLKSAFANSTPETKWAIELRNRRHKFDEPFLTYVYDMKALCRKINPGMPEIEKVALIIGGLRSELMERALHKQCRTVDELISSVRGLEAVRTTVRENAQAEVLKLVGAGGSDGEIGLQRAKKEKIEESGQLVGVLKELAEGMKTLKSEVNAIQRGNGRDQWAAPGQQGNFNGKDQWPAQGQQGNFGGRDNGQQRGYFNQNRGGFQRNNWSRAAQRTVDGRPVCYFCGVAGHYIMDCQKQLMASQLAKNERSGNLSGNGQPRS